MNVILKKFLKFFLLLGILSIWTITYIGACGKEIFNPKLMSENNRCSVNTKEGSFCVQFVNLPDENKMTTQRACKEYYGGKSLLAAYQKKSECSQENTAGICSGLPKEIYAGSDSLIIYYYLDFKNPDQHCHENFHGNWISTTETQISKKKKHQVPKIN